VTCENCGESYKRVDWQGAHSHLFIDEDVREGMTGRIRFYCPNLQCHDPWVFGTTKLRMLPPDYQGETPFRPHVVVFMGERPLAGSGGITPAQVDVLKADRICGMWLGVGRWRGNHVVLRYSDPDTVYTVPKRQVLGIHRRTIHEVWPTGARNPAHNTRIYIPGDRHVELFGGDSGTRDDHEGARPAGAP